METLYSVNFAHQNFVQRNQTSASSWKQTDLGKKIVNFNY